MHLWKLEKWKKCYCEDNLKSGLYLRFNKGVDPQIKKAAKNFCKWLPKKYYFPLRVTVQIVDSYRVKAEYGELVCVRFIKLPEPRIKIASGDFNEIAIDEGSAVALEEVLFSIGYGLTQYFQWINGIHLTEKGMKRQLNIYADKVLSEYTNDSDV